MLYGVSCLNEIEIDIVSEREREREREREKEVYNVKMVARRER